MSTARGSISIIGAGLGGLTAALALQRVGWRVRVFEQAPVLGEVGAGITVSPGSGRALAGLGVGAALLEASLPVPEIAFVHYRTGELLAGVLDQGRPVDHGLDKPRHIHRADLHAILLKAVRAADPDAVGVGRRLVSVEHDGEGVTAVFADGSNAASDLLIGADGSRSAVRRQLFDAEAPEFSGQIAFRSLIPREAAEPFMGGGNAVVSIGGGRIFNRYLVRGGALVNVIGIAKSDRWRGEGWNTPASIEEFTREFEAFNPDVLGLIGRAPADSLIKWGLFVRPPIAQWSEGRVVLIGDAAHPVLPFLGLGAALAIEDGVVLARALDAIADPGRAFAAFQAARLERVEAVRTESIRQGQIIQTAEPDPVSVRRSPSQNPIIFDYDPNLVPIDARPNPSSREIGRP
jgi:salicylate hydroxylase